MPSRYKGMHYYITKHSIVECHCPEHNTTSFFLLEFDHHPVANSIVVLKGFSIVVRLVSELGSSSGLFGKLSRASQCMHHLLLIAHVGLSL